MIYLVAFDIVIYDVDDLKGDKQYYFTAGYTMSFQNWSPSQQQYYDYTQDMSAYPLFYGLSGYSFPHLQNEAISFSLSHHD